MLLSELVGQIAEKTTVGAVDPEICAIVYDSRKIVNGAVFVCIRGDNFDGHEYAEIAVKNGAVAVIACNNASIDASVLGVPVIYVKDTRAILPILANQFYNHPSKKLKLVGVTGTKGKTTTTFLIDSIMKAAGERTGIIGTMGAWIIDKQIESSRTTPESVDIQSLFSEMLQEKVSTVSMEVSSHALIKQRTVGCEFDAAVYTNLTHEHLDFHKTMDEYFAAKMMLFNEYPVNSTKQFTAIVNVDDPRGKDVCSQSRGRIITYGINNPADIMAKNIHVNANGISYDAAALQSDFHVDLKLGGMFNVYNSLAAIGTALVFGIDPDIIVRGLKSVSSVDGRFESVKCGQDFDVIVDYAHTPDSLVNVLNAARNITKKRLILVFGCGGNRDTTKRPMMGKIGSEYADICIITSDNPRKENPESIIDQIFSGINSANENDLYRIADRHKAIEKAVNLAQPGDLIVIAGKGHETYQEFADRTIHFDDREVVKEIISARQYSQ